MGFEISQRIHTSASKREVLDFLEERFRKTAKQVSRSGEVFECRYATRGAPSDLEPQSH
jgi:hypothetical protein